MQICILCEKTVMIGRWVDKGIGIEEGGCECVSNEASSTRFNFCIFYFLQVMTSVSRRRRVEVALSVEVKFKTKIDGAFTPNKLADRLRNFETGSVGSRNKSEKNSILRLSFLDLISFRIAFQGV